MRVLSETVTRLQTSEVGRQVTASSALRKHRYSKRKAHSPNEYEKKMVCAAQKAVFLLILTITETRYRFCNEKLSLLTQEKNELIVELMNTFITTFFFNSTGQSMVK